MVSLNGFSTGGFLGRLAEFGKGRVGLLQRFGDNSHSPTRSVVAVNKPFGETLFQAVFARNMDCCSPRTTGRAVPVLQIAYFALQPFSMSMTLPLTLSAGVCACERASLLLFDDAGVMRFVAWRACQNITDAPSRAILPGHPKPRNLSPYAWTTCSPPACQTALRPRYARGLGAVAFIPLVVSPHTT